MTLTAIAADGSTFRRVERRQLRGALTCTFSSIARARDGEPSRSTARSGPRVRLRSGATPPVSRQARRPGACGSAARSRDRVVKARPALSHPPEGRRQRARGRTLVCHARNLDGKPHALRPHVAPRRQARGRSRLGVPRARGRSGTPSGAMSSPRTRRALRRPRAPPCASPARATTAGHAAGPLREIRTQSARRRRWQGRAAGPRCGHVPERPRCW